MAAYKAAGIFEQTLWVITSDHGMVPHLNPVDPTLLQSRGTPYSTYVWNYLPNPGQASQLADTISASGVGGVIGAYAKVKTNGQWVYRPSAQTLATTGPQFDASLQYLFETFRGSSSPDI